MKWLWTTAQALGQTIRCQLLARRLARSVSRRLSSPYEQNPPAFSYPGTALGFPKEFKRVAALVLEKQLNLIGCHTTSNESEGGFASIQRLEAETIGIIASQLGGASDTIDGFFCAGGTIANENGLRLGRQWLRRQEDEKRPGVVVFTTALTHYSVGKAAFTLDIARVPTFRQCEKCGKEHIPQYQHHPGGTVCIVGCNAKGEMSPKSLIAHYRQFHNIGFRRFIVVPTVGTTVLGSIDPVMEIAAFAHTVNKENGPDKDRMYVHVDAAFGGFTVPFIDPALPVAFHNLEVHSVTLDGHKMGRLPYPSGIFLCRKGLLDLVNYPVQYINGHSDVTLEGSRPALPVVMASMMLQYPDKNGQLNYVKACIDNRDELVRLIGDRFPESLDINGKSPLKVLPTSRYTNQLAFEVPDGLEKHPALTPYELRTDQLPSNLMDPSSCPRTVVKVLSWSI